MGILLFKWLIRRWSLGKTQNPSDAVETASGDESRLEPSRPERLNKQSPQEIAGSAIYHMANGAGDTVGHKNEGPQASPSEFPSYDPVYSTVELPYRSSIVTLGTQNVIASTNMPELQAASSHGRACLDTEIDIDHRNEDPQASPSEFPSCDPVYSTAELPYRSSIVTLGTQNAISSTNIHELQTGSSLGRACLNTEIDIENTIKDSRFGNDRSARSSFYNRYGEIIDTYTSSTISTS